MKLYHSKTYLSNELKTRTPTEIARQNNVSVKTIYRLKCQLGLAQHKNLWRKGDINLLIRNYSTNPNVYNLFPNRTRNSITHMTHKLGIERVQKIGKYQVRDDFFDTWTPESAYVFGWICSDGNIASDGTYFQIHLNKKDIKVLILIRKLLGSDNPLTEHKDSIRLIIHNKKLTTRLIALGCSPRKSLTLEFPNIPDQYLNHFIRGYFDGDGSIGFNKPNTIRIRLIGTRNFLEHIQNWLFLNLALQKHKVKSHHSVAIFDYYGEDARKFCLWMYKNSNNMFLARKHNRYINHLRLRSLDGRV